MIRQIVSIDQDKCEGCGTCVTKCTKGAIQIVDGKAHLVEANVCDALGSCIPTCPMYAITITECDVLEFDSDKAINEMLRNMLKDTPPSFPPTVFSGMGKYCPCMDFKKKGGASEDTKATEDKVEASAVG